MQLIEILVIIIYLFLAYIVQIITHELGHFVFGLMTGYKFISLRLFGFTILKDKEKLIIKKYNLKGSLGQCLMYPPGKDNYKYKLITLGGIIMNVITASIAVLMIDSQQGIVNMVGLSLIAFYGYGIAIISILPSIQLSDGSVLKELKSIKARECNRKQLLIARLLMDGYTYKDIPDEIYVVPEGDDLTNSIIAYHKILESYYYMDKKDWNEAKKVLMDFDKVIDNVPKSIRDIVAAEKMFLALIANSVPFTESVEIESYLRGNGDINFQRVKTAYYINKNKLEKERAIKNIISFTKNYVYKGEAIFCLKLLEEIL